MRPRRASRLFRTKGFHRFTPRPRRSLPGYWNRRRTGRCCRSCAAKLGIIESDRRVRSAVTWLGTPALTSSGVATAESDPGVQKPHWDPSCFTNRHHQVQFSRSTKPFVVVMVAALVHRRKRQTRTTRRPLTIRVHARPCPWSQPFLLPVRCRCSRSASSSVVRVERQVVSLAIYLEGHLRYDRRTAAVVAPRQRGEAPLPLRMRHRASESHAGKFRGVPLLHVAFSSRCFDQALHIAWANSEGCGRWPVNEAYCDSNGSAPPARWRETLHPGPHISDQPGAGPASQAPRPETRCRPPFTRPRFSVTFAATPRPKP